MRTPHTASTRAGFGLLIAATTMVLAIGPVLATMTSAQAAPEPIVDEPVIETASLRAGAIPFASTPTTAAVTTTSTTTTTTTTVPPGSMHVCPAPDAEFIDSWGFARSGGRRHKGVDMMAPYGAPVLAPTDGVVRSHRSSLGGLSFYLDGFDGNRYYGAHLATMDHEGLVSAGMQIGTVGTTGNAHSPHLHFEIHPGGGAAINPYPLTNEWCQIPDWGYAEPTVTRL